VGKKKLVGWTVVALAAAGAAAVVLAPNEAPQRASEREATVSVSKAEAPRPQQAPFTLPAREGLNRPSRDLFASNAPPPPRPTRKAASASEVAAPPPTPVAPPVPYRVAGQVVHDGAPQIVLARDDRVYLVREGDSLDGGYRVESIRADGVTLVYLPLGERQHLAAASSLQAAAAPIEKPMQVAVGPRAQLRWEGPARVQAGSEFEVALKITSDKPVRGSPLQLSYDAKLLEPVSVRAGGFFVDGNFTYRVNPAGSIFVGAFGKGEVAADAEFLVVTFKPIRAGAAELKLSSLVLQGMAGSTLAHEPPAAFRTSITQ
jgi:Cohesin domain